MKFAMPVIYPTGFTAVVVLVIVRRGVARKQGHNGTDRAEILLKLDIGLDFREKQAKMLPSCCWRVASLFHTRARLNFTYADTSVGRPISAAPNLKIFCLDGISAALGSCCLKGQGNVCCPERQADMLSSTIGRMRDAKPQHQEFFPRRLMREQFQLHNTSSHNLTKPASMACFFEGLEEGLQSFPCSFFMPCGYTCDADDCMKEGHTALMMLLGLHGHSPVLQEEQPPAQLKTLYTRAVTTLD